MMCLPLIRGSGLRDAVKTGTQIGSVGNNLPGARGRLDKRVESLECSVGFGGLWAGRIRESEDFQIWYGFLGD